MLIAGGRRVLAGNIGGAVLDVLDEPAAAGRGLSVPLHWRLAAAPRPALVLNIAEDHLDWHATMARYTAAKARVLTGGVAVAGRMTAELAALLDTGRGVRVGFRLAGRPRTGRARRHLVDRAFSRAT